MNCSQKSGMLMPTPSSRDRHLLAGLDLREVDVDAGRLGVERVQHRFAQRLGKAVVRLPAELGKQTCAGDVAQGYAAANVELDSGRARRPAAQRRQLTRHCQPPRARRS